MEKRLTKEDRDDLLGRRLTGAMAVKDEAECPSLEEIAALVDGNLSGKEKQKLQRHLAACDSCLLIFTETSELAGDGVKQATGIRFAIPAGLAAAAVVVLVIALSFRGSDTKKDVAAVNSLSAPQPPAAALSGNGSNVPPQSESVATAPVHSEGPLKPPSRIAAQLAGPGSDSLANDIITRTEPRIYGFSGAIAPEAVAFRLGENALDLELLLRLGNRDGAASMLRQMLELLSQAGVGAKSSARLEGVLKKLESGADTSGFAGCTQWFESALGAEPLRFMFRTGVWVEGGRMAVTSGNTGYIDAAAIRYVRERTGRMQTPQGVSSALRELEAASARKPLGEKELLEMKRAFEEISAMLRG